MKTHRIFALLAALVATLSVWCTTIADMRVNRTTSPEGITRNALFSWQISSKKNDIRQWAYAMRVATSRQGLKGGDDLLMNSGRVESDETLQVAYQGVPLPKSSTIYWQVEVWLSDGKHITSPIAQFTTSDARKLPAPVLTQAVKEVQKERAQAAAKDVFECDNEQLNLLHAKIVNNVQDKTACNDTCPAACALATHALYQDYGDADAVYRHFPALQYWLQETLNARATAAPNGAEDLTLLEVLPAMEQMAHLTGRTADEQFYHRTAAAMKEEYNQLYYNQRHGCYDKQSLAANVLALALGVVPEWQDLRVLEHIAKTVGTQPDSAFNSSARATQHLLHSLSQRGKTDLALKVATHAAQHPQPQGEWLSWLYADLAGIRNAEGSIGFHHMTMQPCFPNELNHVKVCHHSARGPIRSEWTKDGDQLTWSIELPANTTAEVHIPAHFNVPCAYAKGIRRYQRDADELIVSIGSGRYTFKSKN